MLQGEWEAGHFPLSVGSSIATILSLWQPSSYPVGDHVHFMPSFNKRVHYGPNKLHMAVADVWVIDEDF